MIEVKNLSKFYEVHQKEPGLKGSLKSLLKRQVIKKEALKNVNLKIDDGEIIGLIGANGAGKTTLTKILSGIIYPSHGEVSVMGHKPWLRENSYRSQMSVIMGQKAQLWWDLPALDGFLLLKEIYQIPDQDYKNSLEYLSDVLMIKDELKIQVRRLSLGERMKVELMASLLHKPKVVFLDEPTIGLDLTAQKAVRKFIKDYRKEFKPIMILTSHYMDDIEELCERVAIMKEGEIIFDGNLKTITNKYAKTKTIKAQTLEIPPNSFFENYPKELGSAFLEDEKIIVHSPREMVMASAKYLLSSIEVQDLNINEENIASIIEKIMTGRNRD